jgi:hypothetical protein
MIIALVLGIVFAHGMPAGAETPLILGTPALPLLHIPSFFLRY